jgi:uncharacterized protein YndB with AHSA1/START domain
MADIFHHFPIKASSQKVFQAISTSAGLDAWWTKRSRENRLREQNTSSGLAPRTIGAQ